MKIVVQHKQLLASSSYILSLSRNVRQVRNEIDDIEKNMRGLSELDQCIYELRRQKEVIELLTGRLVNLSTNLRSITELYVRTEERNEERLEETQILHGGIVTGNLYSGSDIHNVVQNILKK